MGHVGRILPIAKRLLKDNAEVVFSTYRDAIHYVENEKLPLVKAPPISVQVRPDGSIDFRQTAVKPGPFLASFNVLEQVNAEIRFIESFEPDVVISDSRLSTLLAARLLRIPRVCVLNQFQVIVPRRRRYLHLARFADFVTLTLIGKMWTAGNTVLIPDFPAPYTISIGNLNIPKSYQKNVRLIGPILETRPDKLRSKDELRKKLGLPEDKTVIFAPVSGPIKEKAFLIGILRKTLLQFPEDYEIVMTLGYPKTDTKPMHHRNVTIYKWVRNRFEYLKACDLVIARAGHGTITQAMCYGKPMILVPTPGHTEQINNARQAQNLGVARIFLQTELNRDRLLKTVQRTLENGTTEKLQRVQKDVLRFDGLENATKTIRELAEGKQVF